VLTCHPAPFPLQASSLVAAQLLAFCSAPFSVFLFDSTARFATFVDRIHPAHSSLLAAAPVAAPLLAFCSALFSVILLDSTLAFTAASAPEYHVNPGSAFGASPLLSLTTSQRRSAESTGQLHSIESTGLRHEALERRSPPDCGMKSLA